MEIAFTVPGRPVPAVRMTQRGKYVKPVAQRYLAYKETVGWIAKQATIQPTRKAVTVYIRVFMHGKVADVDNLAKSIMDGCNKIVWEDDRQVEKLTVERFKCGEESERVVVKIWDTENAS